MRQIVNNNPRRTKFHALIHKQLSQFTLSFLCQRPGQVKHLDIEIGGDVVRISVDSGEIALVLRPLNHILYLLLHHLARCRCAMSRRVAKFHDQGLARQSQRLELTPSFNFFEDLRRSPFLKQSINCEIRDREPAVLLNTKKLNETVLKSPVCK